jgi:hypothetical protein
MLQIPRHTTKTGRRSENNAMNEESIGIDVEATEIETKSNEDLATV